MIETKQPSSRTSEKSGVTGVNQIRPCRNSQGPNAGKSTYKLDFEEIRPLSQSLQKWVKPGARAHQQRGRSELGRGKSGAQGPSSCWPARGQYMPTDWVKIREHGRTWPLISESSFGVYSPNTWCSGHGESLLGQLESPSFFTGTKVEFRRQ